MNRRDYLLRMSLIAGSALLPGWARASASADPWLRDFAAALQKNPYLTGYSTVGQDTIATPRLQLEGSIPTALRGAFYRNGPARHSLGEQRYHHWFDGDGMVQAFRFSDEGVSHLGRFVHTEKYVAETKAGKFLRPAFGTTFPDMQPISEPDSVNVANTSILSHAGELMALWEGGSAHTIDPVTLETVGPKVWRDDLKGAPFSAHPKIDVDGVAWNFGISGGMLALYQISRQGKLIKAEVFPVPDIAMVHDFAISSKHLIFLLPSFRFNRDLFAQGKSFLESNEWLPDAAMRVLVIDKSDWSKRTMLELPTGFVFHLGNAWEDKDGVIRFDYVRTDDASSMRANMTGIMRGVVTDTTPSHSALVTLDLTRDTAKQELLTGVVEFPMIDARFTGKRNRHLYTIARTHKTAQRPGFNAVLRRDLETGKTELYDYGDQFMVEEHVFVARPGSSKESDGWLIGTAIDVARKVSVVSVLDAQNLAAGPLARARLPYVLPLGFHGKFVAA